MRLTPRGKRIADTCGSEAAQAMHGLLERLPKSERARILEVLELLAKTLDGVR